MFASTVADPTWTFRVVHGFQRVAWRHPTSAIFILLCSLCVCLPRVQCFEEILDFSPFSAIMPKIVYYWLVWWLPAANNPESARTVFTTAELLEGVKDVKASELREGKTCTFHYPDGKSYRRLKIKLVKRSSK